MFEIQSKKKIKDFGMSRSIKGREEEGKEEVYILRPGVEVAVKWCAPETIAHNKSTIKSDVWMLGKTKL